MQGIVGEVSPPPEGLASSGALWVLPEDADAESLSLVRWRLQLPDGAGQWVLLARMAGEALEMMQDKGSSGSV
jgi:hypothetical protein